MAIDVEKQVEYWRNGADEDLDVARELLASRRIRHGMFFLHLALEKMLKAHVSLATRQVPPKIHNLLTLVERSGVTLDAPALALLADVDRFNLRGRYPDAQTPELLPAEAAAYLAQASELLLWLRQRLSP